MKLKRTGLVASVVMAGLLTLAACGEDPEGGNGGDSGGTGSNDSSSVKCADGSVELNGSGSSAQATAVEALVADYSAICPDTVINYEPSGSGAGRQDFADGLNDFAGSDSPIDEEKDRPGMDERCGDGPALQFPMSISPIAAVYHIEGVDKLTLDGATLAGIFSGQITSWDDPKIAALNDGVDLPSTQISTIHRSTDSGTTDNFTKYLDAASGGAWTYGTGQAWTAPGGEGAPDSAGMVSAVNGTDGAIGYVDGADAKKNDLNVAALDSGSGPVELSPDSVGKAVAAAERTGTGDDIVLKINYGLKEDGAYPAMLATYTMACEKGNDPAKVDALKSFLNYWITDGQKVLDDNGYSALPDELRTDVEAVIQKIS